MLSRLVLSAAGILLSLVICLVAVLTIAILWLKYDQPPTTGTFPIPGLTDQVEVLRDSNGIPHIFASTETDGLMALGYVHAQDRLWQMESLRRAGAGRLSELFGKWTGDWPLRLDREMRSLGLMRRAEQDFNALAPETRTALEAYATGVNHWLTSRQTALPVEFQILRHSPEPWRPADSLVWGKLMAMQLSGNYRDELFRAAALQRLSPERLNELFPRDGEEANSLFGQDDPQQDVLEALAALDPAATLARQPVLGPNSASNGWLLSGQHTASGAPLLANDPHLGFSAPILWYLARIILPDRDLSGATVPGVPFHILGQNGHVGWGFTTTGSDTQDLFLERLADGSSDQYVTPDGPRPFAVTQEVISIRGAPPEYLTVRESRHGPVIRLTPGNEGNEGREGRGTTMPQPGHALALSFTALLPDDRTAEAMHRMNRARDADEFRDALRLFVAPQQNIFYADRSGQTGLISPALVPIRKQGDGRLPRPGWDASWDWQGFIPFDELPQSRNPASGKLINANNAIVGPDYPHLIAIDWPDPSRARRIAQLLKDASAYDVDAALSDQMDSLSLPVTTLLPLLLNGLGDQDKDDSRTRELRRLMAGWAGEMKQELPQPLIYSHWMRALVQRLFSDELGGLFPQYHDLRPRAVYMALTSNRHWCDDSQTTDREDCSSQIRAALNDALDRLTADHGPQMADWRWGAEHQAWFDHQLLRPLTGWLPSALSWGRLSVTTDGDGFTVNRGASRVSDPVAPFAHRHGAGYRMVLDLADPANSRHIIATGQSGNPLAAHWSSQMPRWRSGQAVSMAGNREALLTAGAELLTLVPASLPAATPTATEETKP